MNNCKQVTLATANQHKLREFAQLLKPLGIEVSAAKPEWLKDAVETGATFIENALIKARAVGSHTDGVVIADDSGLVVEALGGEPGVYSARYAGEDASDLDNNRKLLKALASAPNRRAFFFCAIVGLHRPEDPCPSIYTGRWDGEIALTPRGQAGFGYDPLFYVPQLDKTAAELAPEQKNSLSHRGRATRKLLLQLCQERSRVLGDPGPAFVVDSEKAV